MLLKRSAVLSQQTYKISYIYTSISIRIINDLTCNILRNFVKNNLLSFIISIFLYEPACFFNHLSKISQSYQVVQRYEAYNYAHLKKNSWPNVKIFKVSNLIIKALETAILSTQRLSVRGQGPGLR